MGGRRVASALLVAAALVGCAGAPAVSLSAELTPAPSATTTPSLTLAPTATSSPSPTAAAEARVFSFDDGALTIIAPPGALAPGTELVATARGPEDRPPELADVTFSGTFYSLEPDGLTFPEPITIIRRVALADLSVDAGDPLPIITLALRTTDGNWSWLGNQTFLSDGEYLYLSGEAIHTSQVLGFGGTNEVSLVGWALDDDGVVGVDVLADGVPVGRSFHGSWSVSAPLDAPAPPVVKPANNPFAVSPALRAFYDDNFFGPLADPDDSALLSSEVQVTNPSGWSDLPRIQRAGAFPVAQNDFACVGLGEIFTFGGFAVEGLGAGSPLWDRLNLPPPSTTAVFPFHVSCTEPPVVAVEVSAFCLITVHSARGPYISYMRGLAELIATLGYPIVGVEVFLAGANDGEPATGEQLSGNVWEFISGLHNPGKKKIEKVQVRFSNGVIGDITDKVRELLGTDTIDVPFPGEPTFGTCPKGAG